LKHFKLTFLFLVSLSSILTAQKVKNLSYPKGYFLFPIRPGVTNHLSGSLGDLRSGHFHGGLDIKTEQREGLDVYAAADGYISEIRISTGGYGNALFVKHPNGYTTVYGHLQKYQTKIEKYTNFKRLASEGFEISIKPEANELPVKKGEIIAISGNTGGSGGPHLHFEIRNEFNNVLNPLYFGFNEIKDNLAPQIQGLIIKPLDINSKVNQKFGRQYFYPQKVGADYKFQEPVLANGTIGVELLAFDKMNFNNNFYGISCIEVFVNGQESFYYHLEKIPVEDSKDINVHIDFALEKTIGKKYQRLYRADGNTELPIYKPETGSGRLKIESGKTYDIEIKAWDSFENLTKTRFTIFGDTTKRKLSVKPTKLKESIDYQVDENTLIINLKNCKDTTAVCELGVNGKSELLNIAYLNNNQATYLYDLRKGLPQFIEFDEIQQPTNFSKTIIPNKKLKLEAGNIQLNFDRKSLYDTLYLELVDRSGSFQIGQPTIPLKEPLEITYKTKGNFNPEKAGVYNIYGTAPKALKTEWNGRNASFKTKELGNFAILTDNMPPNITPVTKDSTKLVFRISDELSGIKDFKAIVDGKFVIMDYDYKKKLIWSAERDSTNYFKGEIKLIVNDNASNSEIYASTIEEELPKKASVKSVATKKKVYSKSRKPTKKGGKSKKTVSKKKKRR
jgi:Peptidase family M23